LLFSGKTRESVKEEFVSNEVNPFQSPVAAAVPVKPLVAQGSITEQMLIYLKGASPWLRFVGIMGFIFAGFTALTSISSIALIPLLNDAGDGIPGIEVLGNALGAIFGGGMAALGVGGAVLMFFPSFFIFMFGEKIQSYLRTGADLDLEAALKNNKSLWKFAGIYCIVSLAFIPLMIIALVIVLVVALA